MGFRWRRRVEDHAGAPGCPSSFRSPSLSIGAIAGGPCRRPMSSTWARAKRTCVRRSRTANGTYKSTDAGKTGRTYRKPTTRGRSARCRRSPLRGTWFDGARPRLRANPDRGVFRSRDGGATPGRRCSSRAMTWVYRPRLDPANLWTVYASLWNTRRPPERLPLVRAGQRALQVGG